MNPEKRDLEIIKDWLRQQPHLPDIWNDTGLLNFLRGSDFSLENCKRRLEKYFIIRATAPEFFSNRDIRSLELQAVHRMSNMLPLPSLTRNKSRVSILAAAYEPEDESFEDVCRYGSMLMDLLLTTSKEAIDGDIFILDSRVSVFKAFLKTSVVTLKKFFSFVQEAYPIKIKGVHIIYSDSYVQLVYNAIKPFLKEKLKKRVHFHPSLDSLYEFVPRNLLPEEYGGSVGTISQIKDEWVKKMEEYRDWFKKEELVVADLSKVPEELKNNGSMFGLDGSFKQLSID